MVFSLLLDVGAFLFLRRVWLSRSIILRSRTFYYSCRDGVGILGFFVSTCSCVVAVLHLIYCSVRISVSSGTELACSWSVKGVLPSGY